MAPEIAAFLRAQPRELPYSDLAAACAARFGHDAAPDAEAIRLWWLAEPGRPSRTKIARDATVYAFIRDLVGRRSPAEIMECLRERFPAHRIPSRSALYRFVADERQAAIALWKSPAGVEAARKAKEAGAGGAAPVTPSGGQTGF